VRITIVTRTDYCILFLDRSNLSTRFRPVYLRHVCIIIMLMARPGWRSWRRERAMCWSNEKWLFDLQHGNMIFLFS